MDSHITRRDALALLAGAGASLGAARAAAAATGRRSPTELPLSGGAITYSPVTGVNQPWPRIRILQPGAVLEGYDCSGCYVSVEASGATLRDCRFTAIDGVAIVVDLYNGATNLTAERCHFDGLKKDPGSDSLLRARDGSIFVRDCLFEDLPCDAIKMVGGTVERCVFRGAGYATGAHADAISVFCSLTPVRILDNEIDYRKGPGAKVDATSAIAVGPQVVGDITDVLIERNTLLGGGYTLYVTALPGTGHKHRMENVVVRNNLMGDWLFGPLYPNRRPPDLVFANNRRAHDHSLLTGQPQKAR